MKEEKMYCNQILPSRGGGNFKERKSAYYLNVPYTTIYLKYLGGTAQ